MLYDLLALVGVALVCVGLWLILPAAALIALGVIVTAYAIGNTPRPDNGKA